MIVTRYFDADSTSSGVVVASRGWQPPKIAAWPLLPPRRPWHRQLGWGWGPKMVAALSPTPQGYWPLASAHMGPTHHLERRKIYMFSKMENYVGRDKIAPSNIGA